MAFSECMTNFPTHHQIVIVANSIAPKNTNSSSVARKEESLQLGNYLSRRRDKKRRFLRKAIICLIQTNFSTSYSTRSHHIPEYLFLLFQDRQFCSPRNKRQTRWILMLYSCGWFWVILWNVYFGWSNKFWLFLAKFNFGCWWDCVREWEVTTRAILASGLLAL